MNSLVQMLLRIAAAVTVAGLLRMQIWLLFAGAVATIFVVTRRRIHEQLHFLPAEVALLALCAGTRPGDAPSLRVTAVGAHAHARGPLLRRAGAVLRGQDDLREWAVGTEQLSLLNAALEELGMPDRREQGPWRLAIWAAVVAATAVGSGLTSSIWVVPVFVAAFVCAVTALADLREQRQWQPSVLAARASRPGDQGRWHDDPSSVAAHLAMLAATKRVLQRAAALVERSSTPSHKRVQAVAHVRAAEALVSKRPAPRWKDIGWHVPEVVAGVATLGVPL